MTIAHVIELFDAAGLPPDPAELIAESERAREAARVKPKSAGVAGRPIDPSLPDGRPVAPVEDDASAASALSSSPPPRLSVVESKNPPVVTPSSRNASDEQKPESGKGNAGSGSGGDKQADELNRRLMYLPQTDLGNVERFVARFGDRLKWCAALGWVFWDGKRWSRKGAEGYVLRAQHATVRFIQEEAKAAEHAANNFVPLLAAPNGAAADDPSSGPASTGKVVSLGKARASKNAKDAAKKAARELAGDRKKRRGELTALATALRQWGRKSERASAINPLEKHARASLEVFVDAFDRDPLLINVSNGTLVVRRPEAIAEGEPLIILKSHDPTDLITKLAPVDFDQAAICPQFDAFFARVQPITRARRFLMQWHGLSLTGDVSEQKLCVYWGTGRNGKGTLVEACANIAGDYADSVPVETFLASPMQKSGGQATPDLAKLPGVRFLRCGEPDKGAKLGEALIKRVTGGDPIDARNLNKDFFTFFAGFKLTISCNYKPRIGGTDDGIWGRMILVPWTQFIPKPERDMRLGEKLRAEASGILNRLLDGLRDWLESGLVLGEEIEEATAHYRRDSDAVGRFLENCTLMEPDARAQSSLLWETYRAWAKCNSGPDYSNKGLSGILEDRGFQKIQNNVMFWVGIKLIRSVSDFVDYEGRPITQSSSSAESNIPSTGQGKSDDEPEF